MRDPKKLLALRAQLSKQIDKAVDAICADMSALEAADLELYTQLVKPDAMPFECPISPTRDQHHLRLHMAKMGQPWAIELQFGKEKAPKFNDHLKEANMWAERFLPDETSPVNPIS